MRQARGTWLMALARGWFDAGTVERVFEPIVADYQHELAGATSRQRRSARVHATIAFSYAFAASFTRQLCAPLPVGTMGRAWVALEAFAALGTLVLAYVFALAGFAVDGRILFSLAAVAAPLAMVPTAIVLCRSVEDRRHARLACIRVALLVTLLLVPAVSWMIPQSNQRWREAAAAGAHRPVSRGARELTLPELFASRQAPDVVVTPQALRFERHNRASVIVMPLALCVLGLALAGASASVRPWILACAAWGMSAGVWIPAVAMFENGPAWAAPWLPLALAVALAVAIAARRVRMISHAPTLPRS